MKYLLFLLVLGAGLWLMMGRFGRRGLPPELRKDKPESMVKCAQCGLHLPGSEALVGRGGVFCDEQHRRAFEQSRRE